MSEHDISGASAIRIMTELGKKADKTDIQRLEDKLDAFIKIETERNDEQDVKIAENKKELSSFKSISKWTSGVLGVIFIIAKLLGFI